MIPYFEQLGLPVDKLQAVHLQGYFTQKAESLSTATLEKHRTVINGAFDYAIDILQTIEHNPMDRIHLPRKQRKIPKFYSDEQIKALFKAVEGEAIEAPVRLAATFGLRRSECLGLQWDAVNFDAGKTGTIVVRHTIVRSGKGHLAGNTVKETASYRTMPLTQEMRSFLKKLHKHQQEMKSLCGANYEDNGYICKWDDSGKVLRPDYVTNRFRVFLRTNGFPRIRFHDLRHSSASLLINMGFTLKEVQEWLGQEKAESTEIYAHLLYKSKESMAKKINHALALDTQSAASTPEQHENS